MANSTHSDGSDGSSGREKVKSQEKSETKKRDEVTQRCSFCGREAELTEKLFSGGDGSICDRCITVCKEILDQDLEKAKKEEAFRLPRPRKIKEFLDLYVIGQEKAKKSISVAVYNHYKRVLFPQTDDDVELEKSNILLLGPTGTGKTLIAQTLAKMLHVPFSIADATALTEAGYVGEDVENILVRLLQAAEYDLARAEKGIIYIDEIDKIARKDANPSITRDVSGEGVQQALLKILEGTVASIPPRGGRKHPEQTFIEMDTKNILFVCGGGFDGLQKIVESRVTHKVMGFGADIAAKGKRKLGEILSLVEADDLVKYGLIPELAGRLPVVCALDELDSDALMEILTRPKNALTKQYQKFFQMEGVKLKFSDEALEAVVRIAQRRGTGARALRSVMEEAMLNIMYEIPSRSDLEECLITEETIVSKAPPTYRSKKEKAA
jgi:ATP-dependent Clp protease ATP-binding subunit ClpX